MSRSTSQAGPAAGRSKFVLHAATDDILHVGDRVKWSLPALTLWDWLYPSSEKLPLSDQIQKLAATVKVAEDEGKPLSTQEAGTVSFSGAELYDARIETSAVVIPERDGHPSFRARSDRHFERHEGRLRPGIRSPSAPCSAGRCRRRPSSSTARPPSASA